MSCPTHHWLFDLEGIFLGFLTLDTTDAYFMLEVEGESLPIKLTAPLRDRWQTYLHPGDRILCRGRSHVDLSSKLFKLEAQHIFLAPGFAVNTVMSSMS